MNRHAICTSVSLGGEKFKKRWCAQPYFTQSKRGEGVGEGRRGALGWRVRRGRVGRRGGLGRGGMV